MCESKLIAVTTDIFIGHQWAYMSTWDVNSPSFIGHSSVARVSVFNHYYKTLFQEKLGYFNKIGRKHPWGRGNIFSYHKIEIIILSYKD